MSDSYGSELCIYESLPSIAEPLEVIVIFDLTEHCFRFYWSLTSVLQALLTRKQFSCHRSQFIVAMIYNNGSSLVLPCITHTS